MRWVRQWNLVAAFGLLTVPALAGEIADAGMKAEAQAAQGQFLEALDTLQAAQDAVWRESPLQLRKYLFVASDPQSFGVYDVRESNVFRKSDKLVIYAEPVGYGYGRDGDLYTIDIAMDFEVRTGEGKSLATQTDFGRLKFRSRVPNREFFAEINYDFSGLDPGDYEVMTTLRDTPSGKSASFALPFTMTE